MYRIQCTTYITCIRIQYRYTVHICTNDFGPCISECSQKDEKMYIIDPVWIWQSETTQNDGSIFRRMKITLQSSRALPSLPLSEHVSWLFCYLYSHFPLSKIHTDVWRALFIYHINWNSKVVIEENLFDGMLPSSFRMFAHVFYSETCVRMFDGLVLRIKWIYHVYHFYIFAQI